MNHLKPVSIILTAFILLTCNTASLAQDKAPAPEAILKQMTERYTALSSYEDSGVVESVSDGPLTRRDTNIGFKTYFTRPNKLRFEWLDYSSPLTLDRNMIWSDGQKSFKVYSFDPGRTETEDISMAVAGATGISRGSARTLYALLISDQIWGFSLTELTKLSLKGEEVFEGEECYVLEGYHPNGEPWKLWISKRDSLLRKLKTPTTNGEFIEEIRRGIKVNGKVAETIYQPKVAKGLIVNEIDKEKEADIRRALDLSVPRDRVNQQLSELVDLMKTVVPKVPEKELRDVIAELRLDAEMIVQIYVPIYDWHYTADEIKQLLVLYESPLGQKMTRSQSLIELEGLRRGVSIGQELMKRIEERLKAKGYKVTAKADDTSRTILANR
jgi:outer membrane lipoprotein-sorting protein